MKTPPKSLRTFHTDSGAATTIVGGQPKARTQKVSIPVGIEQLLYLAATNPTFRQQLIADPLRAANQANIRLTPIEQEMLKHQNAALLQNMVDRFNPEESRKTRPKGIAAAVALTLATSTASLAASGCTTESDEDPGPNQTVDAAQDAAVNADATQDVQQIDVQKPDGQENIPPPVVDVYVPMPVDAGVRDGNEGQYVDVNVPVVTPDGGVRPDSGE